MVDAVPMEITLKHLQNVTKRVVHLQGLEFFLIDSAILQYFTQSWLQ